MKRWEALGIFLLVVVLVGTPTAVFAGQYFLNTAPAEYTIVAHTVEDGGFIPNQITVTQGEHVRLRLTSADVTHGLSDPELGINVPDIYPGKFITVDFTPTKPGTYPFMCTAVCSPMHFQMTGAIIVVPATGGTTSSSGQGAGSSASTQSAPAMSGMSGMMNAHTQGSGNSTTPQTGDTASAAGNVTFHSTIQPIFQQRCATCHTGTGAPLGLDLSTYDAVMRGANGQPVVVPGKPDQSLLVQKVKGTMAPQMPFGGPPLSATDIQHIEQWIANGAPNN